MDIPAIPTEEGFQNCGVSDTLSAEHDCQERSPRGFHSRFLPPTLTLPLEGGGMGVGVRQEGSPPLAECETAWPN